MFSHLLALSTHLELNLSMDEIIQALPRGYQFSGSFYGERGAIRGLITNASNGLVVDVRKDYVRGSDVWVWRKL